MQQAELLSSVALKVHTIKTDQSFENAWKVVQNFLKQTKESDVLGFNISDTDFQLKNFKDLVEDIRSCNDGSQQYWRSLYGSYRRIWNHMLMELESLYGMKQSHMHGLHELQSQRLAFDIEKNIKIILYL